MAVQDDGLPILDVANWFVGNRPVVRVGKQNNTPFVEGAFKTGIYKNVVVISFTSIPKRCVDTDAKRSSIYG